MRFPWRVQSSKAIDLLPSSVRGLPFNIPVEGGKEGLQAHPAKGARPCLMAEQQAHIPAVLAKGASASGCAGEVCNSRRLAVALKRAFGVSSHPDHCGYLVRIMGDRMQKPIERATQRQEKASEDGKTRDFPRVKTSRTRKAHATGCR